MNATTTTTNTNTTTATRAAFAALPVPPVPAGLCWAPGSATMPGGCDCPRCRWTAARAAVSRDPASRDATAAVRFAATPSRESTAAAILAAIAAAKEAPRFESPGGLVVACLPGPAAMSRLTAARAIIHGGSVGTVIVDDGTDECAVAQCLLDAARAWERVAFGGYGSHEWERVARLVADAAIDPAAELEAWEEEQSNLLGLAHYLVYEASRPTPPPKGREAVSAEADECFRAAGLSEAQIAKIWADNDPSPDEARSQLASLAACEPESAGPYGSMASRVWDDHWARVNWWRQFVD